jgi:hypothetical protein
VYIRREKMNKFFFTKQEYTTKQKVWYDGILIGEIDFILRERKDIDWQKYRSDKTLKLSADERWITTWRAYTSANMVTVGVFNSREEAAEQILDAHRKKFEEVNR